MSGSQACRESVERTKALGARSYASDNRIMPEIMFHVVDMQAIFAEKDHTWLHQVHALK